MSNTANSLTAPSRRTWIGLVLADVALFVLANLTAKNSSHPGTASNVIFIAFVIGAVLLITLAIATVVSVTPGSVTMNPIGRAIAILGAIALLVGVAVTSVSSAASSGLPTLTLALNGRSVAVSGALQSGAVNVVSRVSVQHTEPVLIRLNPGVPFSAFAQAGAAINAHHGDLNYLAPYGSIVFDVSADKGTTSAQTTLQPGNYLAVDLSSSNADPPHTTFVIGQCPATEVPPQAGRDNHRNRLRLPRPEHASRRRARAIPEQRLPRTPSPRDRRQECKKRQTAHRPASCRQRQGGPEARDQRPGVRRPPFTRRRPARTDHRARQASYVLASILPTQDGREQTQLGMERTIQIVK